MLLFPRRWPTPLEPFSLQGSSKTVIRCIVNSSSFSDEIQCSSKRTETPLKLCKKISQAARSNRASLFNRMWKFGLLIPIIKSMSLRKNGRPGTITLQAKFNVPIRHCNSRSVHFLRRAKRVTRLRASSSLSRGSLASINSVSTSIPCTVTQVAGETLLLCFTGIPTKRAKLIKLSK